MPPSGPAEIAVIDVGASSRMYGNLANHMTTTLDLEVELVIAAKKRAAGLKLHDPPR